MCPNQVAYLIGEAGQNNNNIARNKILLVLTVSLMEDTFGTLLRIGNIGVELGHPIPRIAMVVCAPLPVSADLSKFKRRLAMYTENYERQFSPQTHGLFPIVGIVSSGTDGTRALANLVLNQDPLEARFYQVAVPASSPLVANPAYHVDHRLHFRWNLNETPLDKLTHVANYYAGIRPEKKAIVYMEHLSNQVVNLNKI
jgi:hypothetical protein